MDRMEDLKRQYDEKSKQKEELRKQAELTELKLERAGKLVSGLAGERDRWEASVQVIIRDKILTSCYTYSKAHAIVFLYVRDRAMVKLFLNRFHGIVGLVTCQQLCPIRKSVK